MECALIAFAKPPVPGAVKTRLTPFLTPQQAARLYQAFLADSIEQYAQLDVPVRLYWAGDRETLPREIPLCGASVHEQHGADLAVRMHAAFEETFQIGYRRVVIIGTDNPTLPTNYVRFAFEALARTDAVVLGPSDDGGYYLLGMTRFYPVLFQGMRYSHARVFEETLDRAEQTPAHITVLPRWYDVDTKEAFSRLREDLKGETIGASHTRRMVTALEGRLIDG